MSHVPAQNHPAFRRNRALYAPGGAWARSAGARCSMRFLSDGGKLRNWDPRRGERTAVNDAHNEADRPGAKVRQQSMDLLSLIAATRGRGEHVLLTEDDAPLCPGALARIGRSVGLLQVWRRPWSALRTSIGFIGIVVPDVQLQSLAAFIKRYYLRKPPDILLIEWMHGNWQGGVRKEAEARGAVATQLARQPATTHHVTDVNLFLHKGGVSSLRKTHLPKFPRCNVGFGAFLWGVETFQASCKPFGVSPCAF